MMLGDCLCWMLQSGCSGIGLDRRVLRVPICEREVAVRFRVLVLLPLRVCPCGLSLARMCCCASSADCFLDVSCVGLPSCFLSLPRVWSDCCLGTFLRGLPSCCLVLWVCCLCPSRYSLRWMCWLSRWSMAPVVRIVVLWPVPMLSVFWVVLLLVDRSSVVGLPGSYLCYSDGIPTVDVAACGFAACWSRHGRGCALPSAHPVVTLDCVLVRLSGMGVHMARDVLVLFRFVDLCLCCLYFGFAHSRDFLA